jgi:hypothetical protein
LQQRLACLLVGVHHFVLVMPLSVLDHVRGGFLLHRHQSRPELQKKNSDKPRAGDANDSMSECTHYRPRFAAAAVAQCTFRDAAKRNFQPTTNG